MIDQTDTSPEEVVDRNDWRQVNDKEYLQTVSKKVLDDNPKLVNISIWLVKVYTVVFLIHSGQLSLQGRV